MILGIDTSNYMTSVAVVSSRQQLLFDQRILLTVEPGQRGLQQSAAVFQHLENLPVILKRALKYRLELQGISYSAQPRPIEGSYMPVFKVGQGYAKTLASALDLPMISSTHQEGHLLAGLWSGDFLPTSPFFCVHLSGGTTDLLKVTPVERNYQIQCLGGSQDLHAGQFVDRIGVELGLKFPAGPALEALAQQVDSAKVTIPAAVTGYQISFSGPCSAAERYLHSGEDSAQVAFAVFRSIANSLEKVLRRAIMEMGIKDILLIGGVASNSLIRRRLSQRLAHPAIGARLYFADPKYSGDNAVGVALAGSYHFR